MTFFSELGISRAVLHWQLTFTKKLWKNTNQSTCQTCCQKRSCHVQSNYHSLSSAHPDDTKKSWWFSTFSVLHALYIIDRYTWFSYLCHQARSKRWMMATSELNYLPAAFSSSRPALRAKRAQTPEAYLKTFPNNFARADFNQHKASLW